jgi:hypothetical protein
MITAPSLWLLLAFPLAGSAGAGILLLVAIVGALVLAKKSSPS